MLNKGKTKKFRDTIHGYIEIPQVIVKKIIDTEQFQRLHYIEQTSMRPLYPAARHDRFIHSLGVYHLGEKAFSYFRRNSEEKIGRETFQPDWWEKQQLLFTLGCLLHDCAHAPFSHTLEILYELRTVKERNISFLDDRLIKICNEDKEFEQDFINTSEINCKGVGAPHEKLSAYCVISEYGNAIHEIAEELLKKDINKEDLVYIVRMIIGCKYKQTTVEKSVKNCIISMLNSNSIDVDGLDYIVRDAYMSGIDNFSIDYQRLLSSYTAIPVEKKQEMYVDQLDISGIWLKGTHIKIENLKAEKIVGKLTIQGITGTWKKYIEAINSKIEGKEIVNTDSNQTITVTNLKSGEILLNESCLFKKASLTGTITGTRIIQNEESKLQNENKEYVLGFDKNSLSIIQSTVDARNQEYLWVYTHPKVLYSSNFLQVELLRYSAKYLCCMLNRKQNDKSKLNFHCKDCHAQNCGTSAKKEKDLEEDLMLYILGFEAYFGEKSPLPERKIKKLKERGYVFEKSSDADLIALFKRIYIENKENPYRSEVIEKEFREFFTRSHRKALWKSFVEYDNIVKTSMETEQTIEQFCKEVFNSSTKLYDSNYAFLPEKYQEIFYKNGMKDVVLIKSSVKTKQLDPYETLIAFPQRVYRLVDLFDKANLKEKMEKELYYIFADMEENVSLEKIEKLINDLKEFMEKRKKD